MNRQGAIQLASRVARLATQHSTDDDGPVDVAVNVMWWSARQLHEVAIVMPGVNLGGARIARSKSLTVMFQERDTQEFSAKLYNGDWTLVDVLAAQGAMRFFTPMGGGIMVFDGDGQFVCALSVSGRSEWGDTRLAAKAARELGYRTNFTEEGNWVEERLRPGPRECDFTDMDLTVVAASRVFND